MKRFIHIKEDESDIGVSVETSDGIIARDAGYGWAFEEEEYSEWAIVVQFVYRQDGCTAWMASLTQVDGDVKVIQGLDLYEKWASKAEVAIHHLTDEWMPELRINS